MNFIQACDDKERIKKIVLLFYLVFCMEKKKERENKNKRYNRRIKKGAIETRIVEQACNLCVTGTFFWVEKYHKGHIMSHFFTL